VTVRREGRVEKERFSSLEEALDWIESRSRSLEQTARVGPIDTKLLGRYEPAQRVAARLELAGRGGVDVHGDGSVVAYTGRLRRRQVERRGNETAYDALRRALNPRSA
jgi:hypothetical protein